MLALSEDVYGQSLPTVCEVVFLEQPFLFHPSDKKDRENMSRALLMSKEVVQHIDEKVAAYEKLVDIISKMDSRAVTFKNKKFKVG